MCILVSLYQPSFADPALFDLPGGLAAFDDAVDDILVEEAMEQLLQRSFDNEDIMSLAKDTGKQLYTGLPGRKDKINKLVWYIRIKVPKKLIYSSKTLDCKVEGLYGSRNADPRGFAS